MPMPLNALVWVEYNSEYETWNLGVQMPEVDGYDLFPITAEDAEHFKGLGVEQR